MPRTQGGHDDWRHRTSLSWRELPAVLGRVFGVWFWIVCTVAFCYYGVDLIRSAGNLLGWWGGRPFSYAALGVVLAAISLVRLGSVASRLDAGEPVGVIVCGAFALGIAVLVAGFRLGWVATGAIFIPTTVAIALFSAGSIAEERSVYNPDRVAYADDPASGAAFVEAFQRARAGDVTGAVAALERLLADLIRDVGTDHPDVLNTRRYLGFWRAQAGDVTGAVAVFERLLADQVRVFGPDDARTRMTRRDLASWQRST